MRLIRSNVAQRITTGDKKTPEGILPFDFDNKYTFRCLNTSNASGTAKYCISLIQRFYEGNGFKDVTFYKAIVNSKGLTNDKLLRHVTTDLARHNGFAVHINYNSLFQISELHYIPFNDCRLPHPEAAEHYGKIAVYSDWARVHRRNIRLLDIDFIDTFNPDPNVIAKQINEAGSIEDYKGQLLWFSKEGTSYPLAMYDAVLEDMETDARIKNHKRKRAATGYNADYIFVHKGKFENEQERVDFVRGLEEQQGDEGAGNITVCEVESDEQIPELIKIDKAQEKDFYTENELSVQDNIRRAFGFPPILVGVQIAGKLGASQEILEATAYMNGVTNRERREVEEIFTKIYSNFHADINPTKDYSIIPLSLIATNEVGTSGAPLPTSING